MKKKIGELLFQIVPVMIGVYLAFVVSNWSENNHKKQQSKLLTQNLLAEIETNEQRLQALVDYHEMLRDSMYDYSKRKGEMTRPTFYEGTRIMKLGSSAYDTGTQTGVINELPFDKIQALNQLYTYQSDYNDYGNLMMSNLISKDFSENEEEMRKIAGFLSLTMTDIVIKEKDLIAAYNSIKQKLKE